MMTSTGLSLLIFGVSSLIVVTVARDEYSKSFLRHIPASRLATDKRSARVARLPPLVAQSHDDEDESLTVRQVYTIPRVGKSLDSLLDDDEYDKLEDEAVKTVEERQAFSKIPRVGRRSSSS